MEGGPKQPQRIPEVLQDYFWFIEDLNTSLEEKELLKSLVTDKRRGVLQLFLEEDSAQLDILPSKTDDQLTREIVDTIEEVHGDRNPVQVPETMLRVLFTPMSLH